MRVQKRLTHAHSVRARSLAPRQSQADHLAMAIARRALAPASAVVALLAVPTSDAANFSPATVNELIANINTANTNGEDDVINLGGNTFDLTAIDNTTGGDNGLPPIFENGFTLTISNGTIRRDASASDTFRILRVGPNGSLKLSFTTISGGIADGSGAGAYAGGIFNRGTLELTNSTVYGSRAGTKGGGIYASTGSMLTLTNSTISGNSAGDRGGGISSGADTANLSYSTVSDNTAGVIAGGLYIGDGALSLTSTIVAGNTSPSDGQEITVGGATVTADASNLFGHDALTNAEALAGAFAAGATDLTATSDGSVPTPLSEILLGLAENGGSAPTHMLRTSGPAMDAVAACSPVINTDQRGVVRPLNGDGQNGSECDIGAVEIDPVVDIEIIVTGGAVDEVNDGNCSLIEAIVSANDDSAQDACPAGSNADLILLDGSSFSLSGVHNSTSGPNGLPVIDSTITVFGAGSTIERGVAAPDFRFFNIAASGDLRMRNTTLTGGRLPDTGVVYSGGAIFVDGSALDLDGVTLSGNEAPNPPTASGGAVRSNGGSFVRVANSTLSDNSAFFEGGAIDAESNSELTVYNTTVTANTASSGGGVSTRADTEIQESTLSGNSSGSNGGGLFSFGTVSITNSEISSNTADSAGGGVFGGVSFTITDSIIENNAAEDDGGGVYTGGLGVQTFSISNSTIAGNTATQDGGGIRAAGDFTVTNSSISGNSSGAYGGGIHAVGTTAITGSTLNGNSATGGGGGFAGNFADTEILNSTFSGNTADVDGGGIFFNGDANTTLVITQATMHANTADVDGGGIFFNGDTATLENSLIASNDALGNGREIAVEGGTLAADAFNVLGHSGVSDAEAFNGFAPGSDDVVTTASGLNVVLADILDPLLEDNGGDTATHALPFGSPAIDAAPGCPPLGDQRGEDRLLDGDDSGTNECDAGAVEYNRDIADSDDDTMTDGYEIDNDLDPAVDDSGDDQDADGVTNIDEFNGNTAANDPDSDDDGLGDAIDDTPLSASNACTDDPMGPAGAKEFDDTADSGMTTQCGSESQITVRGSAILEIPDARLELFAPNVIFDADFNVPLGTELGVASSDPTPP